jgi:outer membrane cobalamin receptor
VYGEHDWILANPDLGPEFNRGGEGGIEMYFGSRGSLVVTRYNQTVSRLIQGVPNADSVRSLMPNPVIYGQPCAYWFQNGNPYLCSSQDTAGYGYALQGEEVNAVDIRNQGWELQGSVVTGPFTTRGTYSWTKTRSLGITPQYRRFFSNYPQFRRGATYALLPEHTWAMGITYARARTSVALNVTGTGRVRTYGNALYAERLGIWVRLQQERYSMDASQYVALNNGYAMADLTASHRFATKVEGVLQVTNLMNNYTNDFGAGVATVGRTSKVGLRVRW